MKRDKKIDVRGSAHSFLVHFAEHVWPQVVAAAKKEGISISQYVRTAVKQHMEAQNVKKNCR